MLADNDDDGESAAGSRLGHLLGLLVSPSSLFLLVYTATDELKIGRERCRYRGIEMVRWDTVRPPHHPHRVPSSWVRHRLGADRFKHINSAARDALVVGGFLDAVEGKKKGKK